MKTQRTYRIADVARKSGLSVRALHHYHEIGLLVPKLRSSAGYRLYSDDDLLRLQQILLGRELGLSLEQIRRSLDDTTFDRRKALLAQRKELERRAKDTARMIRAVDAALAMIERGEHKVDPKEIFDGFDPKKYEAEAKERRGSTDSYQEAARRTARYSAEDWKQMQAEQTSAYRKAFELHTQGIAPDTAAAMDVAESHSLLIDRWSYPCSLTMHAGLADLYEQDHRFQENIDKFGEGLTHFLAAAIRANARRQAESEPTP